MLLDNVGKELLLRPIKKEVGEMFNALTHSYPFQEVMKLQGIEKESTL